MKPSHLLSTSLAIFLCCAQISGAADTPDARLAELDAYWDTVSRAVAEGDFEGYKATCHPEGVLVSGSKKTSHPLSVALARWEKDFTATKAGRVKASVEFRFSQRFGDAATAHETGIFLYTSEDSEGRVTRKHIHFEALLVKRRGDWKILMEYQKSKVERGQWEALQPKLK